MQGDGQDMALRLRRMLPAGWFGDATPVLDTLLGALATGLSRFWTLLQFVSQQTRIGSAGGSFLDTAASDYFGQELTRFQGETDDAFRQRVEAGLLRPRGTRTALAEALLQLTARSPVVFEPARTTDTDGYRRGGIGYCLAGGWGSLQLPYQYFITVYRPTAGGIPRVAGYGTGGVPAYGNLTLANPGVTDAVIQDAVTTTIPAGTLAWLRISD